KVSHCRPPSKTSTARSAPRGTTAFCIETTGRVSAPAGACPTRSPGRSASARRIGNESALRMLAVRRGGEEEVSYEHPERERHEHGVDGREGRDGEGGGG